MLAPGVLLALSFVVWGDNRDGGEIEAELVRKMAAERPELVLHTGDAVVRGDLPELWEEYLRRVVPLSSRAPMLHAVGNHDLVGDPFGTAFERYLRPLAIPTGAARAEVSVRPGAVRGTHYYAARIGPLLVVVLDANMPEDVEQTRWLGEILGGADGDRGLEHTFVVLHHPPLSVGRHCGYAASMTGWLGLFERHRVRAVFGGHDHAYERAERNGVRYFVVGGGGAPLYDRRPGCSDADVAAVRLYAPEYHYLRGVVLEDRVDLVAVALDGRALDRVSLRAADQAGPLVARAGGLAPAVEPGVQRRARIWAGALTLGACGIGAALWRWRRNRSARAPRKA